MLLIMSTPTVASAPQGSARAAQSTKPAVTPADDVPAPPMALLFGICAIGLIWGRRLAANARKKQESVKPD